MAASSNAYLFWGRTNARIREAKREEAMWGADEEEARRLNAEAEYEEAVKELAADPEEMARRIIALEGGI